MEFAADIGIVGAGPAGARAGELLAATGAAVLLLDPKAPWEKPCGGGLTPGSFLAMPALGELRSRARAVSVVRVEAGLAESFDVPLEHPIWMVSRRLLSQWQIERARGAGATHLDVKVREIRRLPQREGWVLRTTGGDVSVRMLVGADGAAQLGHEGYRWIAGRDYALLGDAAGLANPLTGEGIGNALRSAALFARAWEEGDPLRYRGMCRDAFEGEFRTARFLRHLLFDQGVGIQMARLASRSDWVRTLASAGNTGG